MIKEIRASQQSKYPLIPLREGMVFPKTENVLVFGRSKSLLAMNEALRKDKKIVLVMQKDPKINLPKKRDLYSIGVLALIEKVVPGERNEKNVLLKGIVPVKINSFSKELPYFEVAVEERPIRIDKSDKILAMSRYISSQIKKAINYGKAVDFVFLMNILNIKNLLEFAYQIATILDIKNDERQRLLEINSLQSLLTKEVDLVNRELKILEIEKKISSKTQKKFEEGVKESFLREKMKTIEEELGNKGDSKNINEYRSKISKAKMPEEVEKKAVKELKRLAKMSQFNPESSFIRAYLDWLVELPWSISSKSNINIKKASKVLNKNHYGLKKIKERILEYLAVMELGKREENKKSKAKEHKKNQPTIICFVGPPGVGKTSLGKSIAEALGRKFVKMSLGGIRDEAEIRGHRKTYVGALPGRIIQGIKQAGTNNPVFMLDEIDKIGKDYRGDPSAALLEALDPEQNNNFSDHYLEVPFDLSNVFFITTGNVLDTIPDALRDRLEIIHFPGYTEEEKFNIAKNYLIEKQLSAHYLKKKLIKITNNSLKTIIRRYTREAGVRKLERQIATIFRKIAREIVEKKIKNKTVAVSDLHFYLGGFKYPNQMIEKTNPIGMSTGLAWTQVGGEILFIEVAKMPGKGKLTLTGHLGEVMKESCQASLSYIRTRWNVLGLAEDFFDKLEIHIHVPEGAVPKDGPSAGVSITTAMVSSLTNTPVKRDVAMTGEITLRGRVLEIGGVKEKIIAAHRAGIKTVILPKENKKDLEELPKYVLKDLKFVFASHMDQVLKVALAKKN